MPTALLSVYHKDGIIEFAQRLVGMDWGVLASGGTARHLAEAGVPVQDVAKLVGGAAILGHRVVTISRELHAGLLAKRIDVDIEEMERLGLPYIDLACVDLYPLTEEIAKPEATEESVIEQTDIGGPTMLRSAAKGRRAVICDPRDRRVTLEWLEAGKPGESEMLRRMAAKVEWTVGLYCLASAGYHSGLSRPLEM